MSKKPYIVQRGVKQWAFVIWSLTYNCWTDVCTLSTREEAREYKARWVADSRR